MLFAGIALLNLGLFSAKMIVSQGGEGNWLLISVLIFAGIGFGIAGVNKYSNEEGYKKGREAAWTIIVFTIWIQLFFWGTYLSSQMNSFIPLIIWLIVAIGCAIYYGKEFNYK